MTPIGISFTMTERVLKRLQTKLEKEKAIQTPGIFVSSHAIKIGCREMGGNWISINFQDCKEVGEEFEYMGNCNSFPVFFDKESLYYLQEFPKLTFDLARGNSTSIIFRELEKL